MGILDYAFGNYWKFGKATFQMVNLNQKLSDVRQLQVTIVIPVYNEEGNIQALLRQLESLLDSIQGVNFEILFVDDGSSDQTVPVIMSYAIDNPHIHYLSLSRNFGKDNALMAGINHCKSDAVITMDADLQHPPALIREFLYWWKEGFDVVYAYRKSRNPDVNYLTKLRSMLFYKIVSAFSDIPLEEGISDFKLIDRKVVRVINQLSEDKPFLRGIIKWVGFKQKPLEYEPNPRYAGNSKYNFSNLVHLATEGITSFSTKPLTFAIYLGFIFSSISMMYIPYLFISIHFHWVRWGWAPVIFTLAFFQGLQLIIIGIIGLYLGKTFMQGKNRPKYIIRSSNLESHPKYDSEIYM
jgi:polyisoprenyl-phosphate glycosyltransferase